MNVCLIGDGLISLTLAKTLVNNKIKVFMYCKNNKKTSNNNRTIGITSNNLDFFQKEIIKIKGESDYQYDLKWTRGPIVDELLKTKNVSMKWAFFNKDNRPMMSFYRIGRGIKSMDDFKDAVSIGKSPGLNILYADKKGNIAHFVYGSFFQRSNANASHLVGEAKDFITGEYDYELKHHRINPKDGMLISTNDMPDESRVILKGLWYPKNRHDTTKSLLEKRDDWTMDSMRKVQTSNLDIFAKKFSDIMISDLSNTVMSENEKIAFKFFKKWNHISDLESVGASIYHRMNYELFPLILDEMPEEMMKRYVLSTGSWSFIQRIFPLEEKILKILNYQLIERVLGWFYKSLISFTERF